MTAVPTLALQPETQALAMLALDYLAEARAAANRLREPDDDEALHDLRVALRRLHSLLRSYHDDLELLPAKQRRAVRRLARASNPARDAEVQLAWLLQHGHGLRESQLIGYDWLLAQLQPRSEVTLQRTLRDGVARLHKKLRPPLKVLMRSAVAGERGFAAATHQRAQPLCDDVCAALAAIGGADDVGGAHVARIAVKRLRYLLTPLRNDNAAYQQAVGLLRRLQDLLGDLHDRHVLAQLLSDSVADLAAAQGRAAFERLHRQGGPSSARDWQPPQLPGLLALAQRNEDAIATLFAALEHDHLAVLEAVVCPQLRAAVSALHKPR